MKVMLSRGEAPAEQRLEPYRAVVLGATGAVGSALVRRLLASPPCAGVTTVARRELPPDPKLRAVVWRDFSAVLFEDEARAVETFRGHDVAFCCLGASREDAVGLLFRPKKYTDTFRRVDRDYVVRSAAAARQAGVQHFSMVSAGRASPDARFPLLKLKGEAERELALLQFGGLSIFRPSQLLQRGGPLWERLLLLPFRAIDPLLPARYRGIWVDEVAAAMLSEYEGRRRGGRAGPAIFESDAMLRLAGRP